MPLTMAGEQPLHLQPDPEIGAGNWRLVMGFDALRRLARSAMVALAALAGLLAGPANAEPALWKIQGAQATIYLFGTVHVLKPGTDWRAPKIAAAIAASGALWLEIPDAGDAAALQPLILKYGIDPEHPLSTRIDAATHDKFITLMDQLGVAPDQMEPLRPWMAGVALATMPLARAGYDINSGVEHLLRQTMEADHKPVLGFETAEQQIRYLADMPPAAEIDFFRSQIDDAGKVVSDLDGLIAAWSAGDEPALERLLNTDLRDRYPDLYRRLLVDRNHRFAEGIARLAKGSGPASAKVIFVAVGAGHLVGADSVLADLAKLGLTAVRQ